VVVVALEDLEVVVEMVVQVAVQELVQLQKDVETLLLLIPLKETLVEMQPLVKVVLAVELVL
tara:strand:+ start:185 stop:370 length:186 start_codon:yes stop_codon:yes gene_type:complete